LKRLEGVSALGGAALLLPVAVLAQPVERELGAHEHGRGVLNVAIEGKRVEIELEVPGMDIVGFEHPAKTQRQIAAVAQAKRKLESPGSVFTLSKAAACTLQSANASLAAGEDAAREGQHAGHSAQHHAAKGGADAAREGEHEHAEFHAHYALECAAPTSLTGIDFPFFRSFEGAQKLDVRVVTAAGQSSFEVTRSRPHVSLSGMM
jgi:hypothetical protein